MKCINKDVQALNEAYKKTAITEMAYGMSGSSKAMTTDELVDLVKATEAKGARPISFTAVTDSRAKKGGNPYVKIWKVSQVNGQINTDYEAGVNRQREREGSTADFEAKPRQWGTHVSKSIVQSAKGKLSLSVILNKPRKPVYVAEESDGTFKVVAKEEIAQWLPPVQDIGAGQGLEKGKNFKNYGFEGIVSGVLDTVEFRIADLDPKKNEIVEVAMSGESDLEPMEDLEGGVDPTATPGPTPTL